LAAGGFYANLYNSQFAAHTSVIEALPPALAEERPNPLPPSLAGKGPQGELVGVSQSANGNGYTWPQDDPLAVTEAAALAEMPPLVPLEVAPSSSADSVPAGNDHAAGNGNGHTNGSHGNGHVPAERPMLLERRVFLRPPAPVRQAPAELRRDEDPVAD
jgi:hypothetical protein